MDIVLATGSPSSSTQGPGAVQIFLGNGDGTFAAPAAYATDTGDSCAVVASDLTGNGMLDIITANSCYSNTQPRSFSVLMGKGDGTFAPAVNYPLPERPGLSTSVAVGDVNGDHVPDLVFALTGPTPGIGVALGKGNGTFGSVTLYPTVDQCNGGTYCVSPESVALADMNRDGKLDAVTADGCCYGTGPANGPDVRVWFNQGHGTFGSSQSVTRFGNTYQTNGTVVTANLEEKSGRPPDVVSALEPCDNNGNGQRTTVFSNNGTGTLSAQALQTLAGNPCVSRVSTADLSGNGHPDVLAVNNYLPGGGSDGSLSVYINQGAGNFSAPIAFPLTNIEADRNGGPIAVGDFNGDGEWDVAVGTQSGFSVLLNTSPPTQDPPVVTGLTVAGSNGKSLKDAGGPYSGGTTVSITGTNFQSTSTVAFGTKQASKVVFESPNQLLATSPRVAFYSLPADPTHYSAADVYARVTNTFGTSAANLASRFTYFIPQIGLMVIGTSDVCTATVATDSTSPKNNVILTGGHCVADGGSGAFRTADFSFAPGFYGHLCASGSTSADFLKCGTAPYGVWKPTREGTTGRWFYNADDTYDVGFLAMASQSGRSIASVVGGALTITWNPGASVGANQSWTLFGDNLGGQPDQGQAPVQCSGVAAEYTNQQGYLSNPSGPMLDVNQPACQVMISGNSGGPWINGSNGTSRGIGAVNKVSQGGFVIGTYLGDPNPGSGYGDQAMSVYDGI